MTTPVDPHALKAIASLQHPGKPDLLNKLVELFKLEFPKSDAALRHELALYVSKPV